MTRNSSSYLDDAPPLDDFGSSPSAACANESTLISPLCTFSPRRNRRRCLCRGERGAASTPPSPSSSTRAAPRSIATIGLDVVPRQRAEAGAAPDVAIGAAVVAALLRLAQIANVLVKVVAKLTTTRLSTIDTQQTTSREPHVVFVGEVVAARLRATTVRRQRQTEPTRHGRFGCMGRRVTSQDVTSQRRQTTKTPHRSTRCACAGATCARRSRRRRWARRRCRRQRRRRSAQRWAFRLAATCEEPGRVRARVKSKRVEI